MYIASQVVLEVKNLPVDAGDVKNMGSVFGWEDPLEEGMATTPVFLPGESHGQSSLGSTAHGVTKSQTRLK